MLKVHLTYEVNEDVEEVCVFSLTNFFVDTAKYSLKN